jgi:hypothetical protein
LIEQIPSAKKTKAAMIVRFALWMGALGRKSVRFGRLCDVLFDAPTLLEAETKIIRRVGWL